MAENENFNEAQIENETKVEEKTYTKEEIIDLDASDSSDIEIIKVRKIVTNGKRKNIFKNTLNNLKTADTKVNSVNGLLKNQQESFIKEEIIISDGSDSADGSRSNKLKFAKKRRAILNYDLNSFKNKTERRNRNKNESLSSIILNCPRCNKTKTLFTTTIKSTCKECKVNMSYVCNKCSYRYDSLPALYRHKKIQCRYVLPDGQILTPTKAFIRKCSKCRQTQKLWQTRMNKKCPTCKIDMSFECIICSKSYTSYSGLYVHAKLQCQPNLRTYYCSDCSYKCTSQRVLLRHINTSHLKLNFMNLICKTCEKSFTDAIRLKAHKLVCGITFYYCKFCTYRYKHQDNLNKHLITYHKSTIPGENIGTYAELANKKNDSKDNVLARVDEKEDLHRMKKMHCPTCNTSIPYVTGLFSCNTCKTPYRFQCSSCGKIFNGLTSLYRHIRRMHGQLKHSCKNCGKLFSFFGDVNEHHKTCGSEPRFECNICFFKTRYKYNLRCHMHKLHNENRQSFTCSACGIEYKTARSIKRHLLIGCK